MRRDVRILLATVAFGGALSVADTLPGALSEMQTFSLRDVEVRGARYLTTEAVVGLLDIGPEASVWNDEATWLEPLLAHPLIEAAEVRRRLPDGLVITVTERRPVALAATPTLEPVDAEGRRLPIDPSAFRLDLPVISTSRVPPDGATMFPEDVRALAAEVARLMAADTAFLQLVSSVRWGEHGALIARWTRPPLEFLMPPGTPPSRVREGLAALSHAMATAPGRVPEAIDLRFADQVVVRSSAPRTVASARRAASARRTASARGIASARAIASARRTASTRATDLRPDHRLRADHQVGADDASARATAPLPRAPRER